MKLARWTLLTVLLLLMPGLPAAAQNITVSGKVVDQDQLPIPGVTVMITASQTGTITDLDGNYSIEVPAQAVLEYSCIGYTTQQVEVGGRTLINIVLEESSDVLDEVVFVAYGQQKKESVVAAISAIDATGLRQTPASNLSVALAGRLPGLTVLQRSGVPGGESMEFHIRGMSTINGQEPLTLVDGVERDFSALDPREVETITILKDASATAVYGVRGANGVIIVTTRRGVAGKPVIDVSVEQSWQQPTRLPDMVNAYDYALLRNQVELQNNRPAIYSDEALEHYRTGDFQALYPTRDFLGEFINNFSPMQRVNVNVSGGSEKMRYFTTVGYLHQNGAFKTEKFNEYDYDPTSKADRVNFRSNFDIDITKSLSMFLNISGYMQKKNDPVLVPNNPSYLDDVSGYSILMSSLIATPNNSYNDLTPDGEVLSSSLRGGNVNNVPYGMLNRSGFRNTQTTQITATLGVEWDMSFITPGLKAKAVASYDAFSTNQQVRQRTFQLYEAVADPSSPDGVAYQPIGTMVNSTLSDAQYSSFNNLFNIDASLEYAREFGKHDITGMLLFNRYQRVINIELPYNYIGLVGRVTYGYADKYLAEVNFGYNGSEQFAPGHKMGFFPSFSLGWVLSEEDFLKDSPWLTFAKIRASYGQVGNDNMNGARFAFLTLWTGSHESQIGNPELEWEKANKYNIGFDIGLFSDFRIEADLFYERRDNILIPATGLIPSGVFGTGGVNVSGMLPKINAGVIENKGFEITGSWSKIFNPETRIDIRLNSAFNRNKVLNMREVKLGDDYACQYRSTGFRIGQNFGYETAGFFNSEEDILNWYDQSGVGATPQPGDLKYVDQTGDGIVDERDMVPIGDPEVPEWTFGAGLNFQWKGFDFSMMWQGAAGRSFFVTGQRFWETYNFNEWHKQAWSRERLDAGLPITYPRLEPGSEASKVNSDFWLADGDYLRLKNLEIGYTLPKKVCDAINAEAIRIYVNGLNLLTFDKYPAKYIDPEQNNELLYPVFRTFNIGLNLTF